MGIRQPRTGLFRLQAPEPNAKLLWAWLSRVWSGWPQILSVRLVLAHDRRRVLHFNVTSNPTAEWTAQQVVEAFPWEISAKYLLRDRDKIYGDKFHKRVENMGFDEIRIAPRSPWQNPYVERLIGSIRRECQLIADV